MTHRFFLFGFNLKGFLSSDQIICKNFSIAFATRMLLVIVRESNGFSLSILYCSIIELTICGCIILNSIF